MATFICKPRTLDLHRGGAHLVDESAEHVHRAAGAGDAEGVGELVGAVPRTLEHEKAPVAHEPRHTRVAPAAPIRTAAAAVFIGLRLNGISLTFKDTALGQWIIDLVNDHQTEIEFSHWLRQLHNQNEH